MKPTTLTLTAEKKHSVRYDAHEEDPAVTTVYVMKTALPRPYPKKLRLTLEDVA